MWMDWNDPAELRRLRDLLGRGPAQQVTVEGPDGPVTDSVEMIVGRLGMPELGGSYFTFSNENNDLIWGFLAECNKRGWLYKGHDSMPWCTRCGTGISQMEMNEGYQDREDPGLTVRLPLVDRPGEWLLVWTTTPWTLAANVAAAVGPELTYVKVRQGDDKYWLGKGTLKTALRGKFEVLEERPGATSSAGATAGRSTSCPPCRRRSPAAGDDGGPGYEHRVVPWDEVGEEEGTGIVHIAPGCGAEDYQLGKALGLPVIAPLDEDGHYLAGFGWLSGLDAHAVAERVVEDLEQKGNFYHLEPYTPPLPALLALRHAAALPRGRRVVHLDGRGLRQAARPGHGRGEGAQPALPDHGRRRPDPVDPGLRLRARARLAAHDGRLDDLQEALLGPGAAHLGVRVVRPLRRRRRPRRAEGARRRRLGRVRRAHAAPALRRRGQDRLLELRRRSRIADVGNPWLDAGIVPFSTMHYRTEPDYWRKWFPADFITESFPGQFRNWFYSMLAMSTVLRREPPFKTILGYATLFGEDGRPMHKSWGNSIEFNEAAERMGVDVMRWMYAKPAAGGQHPLRLPHGRRGAARAARAVERLRVLRDLRPTRRMAAAARRAGWPSQWTPLDRWILSRTAAAAADVKRELADFDARGRAPPGPSHRRAVDLVPAALAAAHLAQPRPRPTATRRSRRSTPRWSGRRACWRRCCPSWPSTSTSSWSSRPTPRRPTRPPDPWPGERFRRAPRRAARVGDGDAPARGRADAHVARPGGAAAAPAAAPDVAGHSRGTSGARSAAGRGRAARAARRRDQRQARRGHRRRIRAGRASRSAAAAQDRQAPGRLRSRP